MTGPQHTTRRWCQASSLRSRKQATFETCSLGGEEARSPRVGLRAYGDAHGGVRCSGPAVPGELSRCGPEAGRRRRGWTRADSLRRAVGRAVREGVPPRLQAALCEPARREGAAAAPGTPGRGGRARARAGRPLCAISAGSRPTDSAAPAPATPSALLPPLPESGRQEMPTGRPCVPEGQPRPPSRGSAARRGLDA
ncbi:hypothetical protein R6Z07F_015610 [Ovis aries]